MEKIEINYEHELFTIEISKENKFYKLKRKELLDLQSIKEELKDRKFLVKYTKKYSTQNLQKIRKDILKEENLKSSEKVLEKNLDYKELITIINDDECGFINAKVIDPENIIRIESEGAFNVSLIVKDPNKYTEELIDVFIKTFNYLKNTENYEEFIELLRIALEGKWNIIENEEFPSTMLKFYKNKDLIKSVYIKDNSIKFVDFAEEYKKLKIKDIKETLQKVNENLKLAGKENIKLGFKEK